MPTIACIDSSVYCCADSVRKVKQTSKLVVDLIGMINNGILFFLGGVATVVQTTILTLGISSFEHLLSL